MALHDKFLRAHYGNTQPELPQQYDCWFDIATGLIYKYIGETWIPFATGYYSPVASLDWLFIRPSSGVGLSHGYIEIKGTAWIRLGARVFIGKLKWLPNIFKVIVRMCQSDSTGTIRLQDLTNNKTLAEVTITSESMSILTDDSLSDLPDNEVVVEVQAKTSGSNDRMEIYSAHLWRQ